MSYQPSTQILEVYANVLVNFALNSGQGVRPGEVVQVQLPEVAKPLYVPLRNAILRAGALPLMQFLPDDVAVADVYTLSSDLQLDHFMESYYRGLVDQIDHSISIIAEADKYELQGVDPIRLMRRQQAGRQYRVWRDQKEAEGRFTWTLALYGTEAMAAEVELSLEAYWQEIIRACFLDLPDPIAEWRKVNAELAHLLDKLNALAIERVHLEAPDIDLWLRLGKERKWLGGSGRNIPSFELFTSPDWRGTEGTIAFNQPLYRYGNLIEGIRLRFVGGRVVESSATKNQELLQAMIATEGADRLGEFSLTDRRHSRISKMMAETLFDENIGGPEGNTHVALGNAYRDCYAGDPGQVSNEEWSALGYNSSVVHTDIISTAPRTVTAYLPDGTNRIIYQNGEFQI